MNMNSVLLLIKQETPIDRISLPERAKEGARCLVLEKLVRRIDLAVNSVNLPS